MKVISTTATQTTTMPDNAIIQTDISIETKKTYEYCVSRVDPNANIHDELLPNTEPPTMTITQLEASHNLIVNEIVATIDRETNTLEEDTPLYRRKQKVLVLTSSQRPIERTRTSDRWSILSGNGTGTHSNCRLADTGTTYETDYM